MKGNGENGDHECGYGKPPKHTQFRKGRSGNPKGRPLGSRNASTLLDEALKERVMVSENGGRRREITKLEAILKQLVNKAAQGDPRATRLLLAHQIPRIEEHEASRSATAERSPLPPPPSPEEQRRRDLEIAKILRDAGSLDESAGVSDAIPAAQPPASKPK
jgi:Family of unknown function (DUF5681)